MNEEELKQIIAQIEEQKIYKNWKELCEVVGWSNMGGSTKKKYCKLLSNICKYHKEGHKIIIEEIYEEPLSIINGRETNKKNYPQYVIEEKYNKSIGIYKIILNNKIYIGSTIQGFRLRFLHHINKDNPLPTKEMLDNGATFEILQICDDMTENEIRHIEDNWIQEYRNNSKWEVVNNLSNVQIKGETPQKYKKIKVREEDYETCIQILQSFGIKIEGLLKDYSKEELKNKIDKK